MIKKEEHSLQVSCVRWFKYQYPKLLIFAVPNGGFRNVAEATNLKREGVLAGVADLIILCDDGKSIFVEMKTPKGKQSINQSLFETRLKTLNHRYYIIRTIEEFMSMCHREL